MGPLVIKQRFRQSGVGRCRAGGSSLRRATNPSPSLPWHWAGGGRGFTIAQADRGGGGADSAREGRMPLKQKPGANQPRWRRKAAGSSAALRRGTHLPSACWGRAGWRTPHPRTPAAAAPGMPSALRHGWDHQARRALCHRLLRQPVLHSLAPGPAAPMSIPTFYDVFSGQAPLCLSPGKGKVVRARRSPAPLPRGGCVTYFPPQKILVVMTRLDRLQGERRVTGCSASFASPLAPRRWLGHRGMKSPLPPPFLLDDVPQHHLGPAGEGDVSACGGCGDTASPPAAAPGAELLPTRELLFLSGCVGSLRCSGPRRSERSHGTGRLHGYTHTALPTWHRQCGTAGASIPCDQTQPHPGSRFGAGKPSTATVWRCRGAG